MRRRAAVALAVLALACSTAPPPAAPAAGPPSEVAATLLPLGDAALAARQPELARVRFERALAASPGLPEARIGRGRALAALGRPDAARTDLEAGLAARPDSTDALVALADLDHARGDTASARARLDRAIALEPGRIDAHLRLSDWTGPAPPGDAGDPVARAEAHPYDAGARLAAGEALLARGDMVAARQELESVLTLADLDPPAAARAARDLADRFPDWRARRIVWVHAYCDELLRADPAWRFQQRIAWLAVSVALDPVLGTRFLVADLGAFASAGSGFDLPGIAAAAHRQVGALPRDGVVAFLTGLPSPHEPGVWREGQAEFLGRELTVRLAVGAVASRVLAHELIHLFGGIHVNPQVDSLMNPTGRSTVLDPLNEAMLRVMRVRRFGPGGIEPNVIDVIPLEPAIRAYAAALGANVALRNAGVAEALAESRGSVRAAAPAIRASLALDPHLGDVASFVGALLARDRRFPEAARLYALSAQLYGPGSGRGRRALANARALAGASP